MARILLIDNYDSFTFNLVEVIRCFSDISIDICQNDRIPWGEMNLYEKILISPGPGIPGEAGSLCKLIQEFSPTKDILGVCLGHQAIAKVFGAELIQMARVSHGLETTIIVKAPEDKLFIGLPEIQKVGLYHSWAVNADRLPSCLEITALSEQGIVMGIRHRAFQVRGVQFHPESYISEHGPQMLKRWISG